MADYQDLGLNSQLQPNNALVTQDRVFVTGADAASDFERNVFAGYQIKNLSFDKISGGTAVLGGTSNGNGVLSINNTNGSEFFRGEGGTVKIIFPTGGTNLLFDAINETIYLGPITLGGTAIGASASGQIQFYDGSLSFGQFTVDEFFMNKKIRLGTHIPFEIAGSIVNNPVGTPTGNSVRIYVDTGGASGKNRIMAQFDSGTPVVIATKP